MKGVKDALTRLEGAKSISVRLQDGIILVETDATKRVSPSRFWKEVSRVGFAPEKMEVWATGVFEGDAFVLDGARWPLANAGPGQAGRRRARFRVIAGDEDPPRVEFVE